jgi:hypothetical protein
MTETATAITPKTFDAPAAFGSRGEIQAIADRVKIMMPSARLQEWQLEAKYKAAAEASLTSALYKVAQLAVFYRLLPGEDLHILPFGNLFVVDIGIDAHAKAADRYSRLLRITYHVAIQPMPIDELKARRGDQYESADRGAIARLWRSDKAQAYELLGLDAMTTGYGIWRKKAQWDKKKQEWQEDQIPAHRTPQDVADRRARKMVLSNEFSLDALLAATPAEEQRNLYELEREIQHIQRDRTTLAPQPHTVEYDDDGLLLWKAAA